MDTAEFFSKYTEAYEAIMSRSGYSYYGDLCDLHLKQLSGLRRILESGCGPGNFVQDLLGNSKVWAIDYNHVALERLKSKVGNNSNLVIACQDLHTLPYENDYFDGISSMLVLPFMAEPRKYLEEHKRVLKPNGVFVISGPSPKARDKVEWMMEQWKEDLINNKRWEKLKGHWEVLRRYTIQNARENVRNWYETEEVCDLLRDVGLKIRSAEPNPLYFGMGYVVTAIK